MRKQSKIDSLTERVQSVLDTVGIDPHAVQVFEFLDDDGVNLIYPNYMQQKMMSDNGIPDKKLIEEIEAMMVEHMLDVQRDLKLIKRYKEMMNEIN